MNDNDRDEGANVFLGDGCPPFLGKMIAEAVSVAGPVTVYASEDHRRAARVDEVATAAIQAAWQFLVERMPVADREFELEIDRMVELETALEFLKRAETSVRERLGEM